MKYVLIGNAENTHMVKWARALSSHFELYIISSKTTSVAIQEILPLERIFDLNLKVDQAGGNYQLLFQYSKVLRILKKIAPDIVNAHYLTSHGTLAALIKRTNSCKFFLIQSAWGSDILVTPFRNSIYRSITRFALGAADLVTSDSSYMTSVIEGLKPCKTMTFSFGLERLPELRSASKEPWTFFSNRILSENYRIDEIIRFFKRILRVKPEATLVISHNGPLIHKLKEQVAALGTAEKVSFVGFLNEGEQADLYRRSQFYVSIPKSDATSVSLLEAMAYGCIPIVSDLPANREWIENEKNGLLYRENKTTVEELTVMQGKITQITETNRDIISQRAIFPESIKQFADKVVSMIGEKK